MKSEAKISTDKILYRINIADGIKGSVGFISKAMFSSKKKKNHEECMLGAAIIRCEYISEESNILCMPSIGNIFPGNCFGAFCGHAYVKVREHVLLQNKITDRNILWYAQLVT